MATPPCRLCCGRPARAWLAVAAPAIIPAGGLGQARLPLPPWSVAYYRRIAALADEVDPLLYDTGLRSPAAYGAFVASQARTLVATLPAGCIRLALPAFAGHNGVFDSAAENIGSGLAGLTLAFPARHLPPALAGVALYPLWSMRAPGWAALDRWLSTN